MKWVLSLGALLLAAFLTLLFSVNQANDLANFYSHPAGYKIAEIFRSTGFVEQDAYYQVLVRSYSRARWRKLWHDFHANSSPDFYISKTSSILLISECVPSSDEAHSCGVRFFSTAYDLKTGKLLASSSKPDSKTHRQIAALLARKQHFSEITPQSRQNLGCWFWQNFWLKSAYGHFGF